MLSFLNNFCCLSVLWISNKTPHRCSHPSPGTPFAVGHLQTPRSSHERPQAPQGKTPWSQIPSRALGSQSTVPEGRAVRRGWDHSLWYEALMLLRSRSFFLRELPAPSPLSSAVLVIRTRRDWGRWGCPLAPGSQTISPSWLLGKGSSQHH